MQVEAFSGLQSVTLVRHISIPRNRLPDLSDWLRARAVVPVLTRLMRRTGAAIVHAHTEAMAPLAVEAARVAGGRVATTIHGINTDPAFLGGHRRQRVRDALTRSDRVIMVGETLRPQVQELAGRTDHACWVPNGFRGFPVERRVAVLDAEGPLRFVSVSNLHEGKGVDVNLKAMAQLLRGARSNLRYTIVGGGHLAAALKSMVQDLGLESCVRFTGPLSPQGVAEELASSDVFVLPSSPEAFGIAYLEAMAAGCLAIGVRGEGPSAFIRHGESGLLVEPADPDSLAAQLGAILDNPGTFRAMAAEGQRVAREEYTWTSHAKRLAAVYADMLEPSH